MHEIQPDYTGILNILSTGDQINPVSATRLSEKTGLSNREIRRAVERLRREGWPICSSHSPIAGGYWLARSHSEFSGFEKTYAVGAISRFVTLRGLKGGRNG